eukprot:CAMPEP_0173376032 /NCGR_PEP_ID=MMETSP1144-20121109/29957_1 /TAXON_ID=483371 /ORGANISM="non described non described, Strain CCMP2298" /LENGTH=225 /DNA_ID=CAMNT_0014328531 /DNA_START=118 /DNA_END=795 /DNA_ORIENTATION=+
MQDNAEESAGAPDFVDLTGEASSSTLAEDVRNGSPVVWKAAVQASVKVKEVKRSVEDYMALPASQYSVLSAEQVVRLSDSDFKIVLGNLNFFGTKITPVLYVTVNVYPEEAKAEIIVTRAETTGSDMADAINGTFSITAVNTVTAGVNPKGKKTLSSDTKLQIDAIVPKSRFPLGVIKNGGNFVMQSSLNLIVPTFVRILASDFKRWSAGDDERTAVEGASLNLQ